MSSVGSTPTGATMSFCKERVWDNGDMDSCGKIVYGYNMCKEHFIKKRKTILKELDNLDLKNMSLTEEMRMMIESVQ